MHLALIFSSFEVNGPSSGLSDSKWARQFVLLWLKIFYIFQWIIITGKCTVLYKSELSYGTEQTVFSKNNTASISNMICIRTIVLYGIHKLVMWIMIPHANIMYLKYRNGVLNFWGLKEAVVTPYCHNILLKWCLNAETRSAITLWDSSRYFTNETNSYDQMFLRVRYMESACVKIFPFL